MIENYRNKTFMAFLADMIKARLIFLFPMLIIIIAMIFASFSRLVYFYDYTYKKAIVITISIVSLALILHYIYDIVTRYRNYKDPIKLIKRNEIDFSSFVFEVETELEYKEYNMKAGNWTFPFKPLNRKGFCDIYFHSKGLIIFPYSASKYTRYFPKITIDFNRDELINSNTISSISIWDKHNKIKKITLNKDLRKYYTQHKNKQH